MKLTLSGIDKRQRCSMGTTMGHAFKPYFLASRMVLGLAPFRKRRKMSL